MAFGRKQKRKRFEADNLKRARESVQLFSKDHEDYGKEIEQKNSNKTSGEGKTEVGKLKRKQIRKEGRKLKKLRKLAYYTKQPVEKVGDRDGKHSGETKKRRRKRRKKKAKVEVEKEDGGVVEGLETAEDVRRYQLQQANKDEDKLIHQMEKQLKFRKKKVPAYFASDGLDYLLDVCDSEKAKEIGEVEGGTGDNEFDVMERNFLQSLKQGSSVRSEDERGSEDEGERGSEDEGERGSEDEGEHGSEDEGERGSESEGEHGSESEESEMENVIEEDDGSPARLLDMLRERVDEVRKRKSNSHLIVSSKKRRIDECVSMVGEISEGDDDNGEDGSHVEGDTECSGEEVRDGDDGENESSGEEAGDTEENNVEISDGSESETEGIVRESPSIKTDIYGRSVDAHGELITSSKYVPPAKRLADMELGSKETEERRNLLRQLKGLLNRTSEATMASIITQMEQMFRTRSRNDMNESLTQIVMDSCVGPGLAPPRIVMDTAMLVAMLHQRVGQEVGAHLVQALCIKFKSLFAENGNYGSGKTCDGVLILICHLYNFKVFDSLLIYDVLKLFVEQFTTRDVELILLLLKTVGFSLRKDDPIALKQIIVSVQKKVNESDLKNDQRTGFMLETLMAIKNNDMRKIPNYDPSVVEHIRKVMRGLLGGRSLEGAKLKIPFSDFVKAHENGRWWIVGSAWSGREGEQEAEKQEVMEVKMSSDLEVLARKQRMNTSVRRAIFAAVMTCEDYMDAFEKLCKLKLKQEQEIACVLMDCCLQEKHYNPFYAQLLAKFCKSGYRFQLSLQCFVWDKFKELSGMTHTQQDNMAKCISELLEKRALTLNVLKSIDFAQMGAATMTLLRRVLSSVLMLEKEEDVAEIFGKVSAKQKLLIEGLNMFLQHFLSRHALKVTANKKQGKLLGERIQLAGETLANKRKNVVL